MTKKLASILALCLSLACGVFSTPEPTATPRPQPTLTSVPTVQAITTSEIDFGDITQLVVLRGFTIEIPIFYPYKKVENDSVFIANEEDTLSILFISDEYSDTISTEEYLKESLTSLNLRDDTDLNFSEPEKIVINDIEGVRVNLQGQLIGISVEGMSIAISPSPNIVIFSIATSDIEEDPTLWESQHKEIFEEFIKTIQFVDMTESCTISTDETYGYTQENPIKVGGDVFEGVSRERAYLDNLLGPNGEELSYERNGSIPTDTIILDAYQVKGAGIDEVLYVDIYNYSEPQAPVGFTCKGAFPLSAP
jgi:adenylate kinase family enzyme